MFQLIMIKKCKQSFLMVMKKKFMILIIILQFILLNFSKEFQMKLLLEFMLIKKFKLLLKNKVKILYCLIIINSFQYFIFKSKKVKIKLKYTYVN